MSPRAPSIARLVQEFARLPGIGERTAERLAFHVVHEPTEAALRLAEAIREVKQKLKPCARCNNLTEGEACEVCADPARDASVVCVVEQPKDLQAIEATGKFRGGYHVLQGHLAPQEGRGPDSLSTAGLLARLKGGGVRELIVATDPDLEGEGTALHIREIAAPYRVKVTRLARGLSPGSTLEQANKAGLTEALLGRREM